ncbi:hypothetical protein C0585_03805 [Candidatus Woesearchaeota archaeon]|nr:MAG: hypothetical protein C0585_03805 [Candidatus Woesearchaeota archaeon]
MNVYIRTELTQNEAEDVNKLVKHMKQVHVRTFRFGRKPQIPFKDVYELMDEYRSDLIEKTKKLYESKEATLAQVIPRSKLGKLEAEVIFYKC